MERNIQRRAYLGDGAYYAFDGHGVMLTAENGVRPTDRVYLEPEVISKLIRELCADYNEGQIRSLFEQGTR